MGIPRKNRIEATESIAENTRPKSRRSGRGRLVIVSGQVYELTLRARRGLPFIPLKTMNLLIESAMAQACYLTKLSVCHYVWMSNHAHILLVARNPESLVKFYGIVKKSLTDSIKRLLNIDSLRLWEGRKVHLVPCPETVVERIAYFYSNPAKADLVDRIEEYPGCSSYEPFRTGVTELTHDASRAVPWVRAHYLEPLKSRSVSAELDAEIEGELRAKAYYDNELKIEPNGWMAAFNIAESEVGKWNGLVLQKLSENQGEARRLRKMRLKVVMGRDALLRQKIMKSFTPKKTGIAAFVICRDKETRLKWIAEVESIRRHCEHLYHSRFKLGQWTEWPPGVFPSRAPLRGCRLS